MTDTPALPQPKTLVVTPELHDYLVTFGTPPDDIQRALIEETRALGGIAMMQVAPEQGTFMTILTKVLGVNFAVEVGTFTGYSALCVARGLAPGGRLLCCDVSEEWTAIARRYWDLAGVADRIDLRIAPALDTLRSLPDDTVVDLAFLDADKPHYIDYYEELLPRLRPGGLLLADNVLWSGKVVEPDDDDPNLKGIRAFNEHVAADDRIDRVILPISDGLTIARKRE